MTVAVMDSWVADAACRTPGIDPDAFFPEDGDDAQMAKLICRHCPVQIECLEFALASEGWYRYGIYGGMSARKRRAIAKYRAAA